MQNNLETVTLAGGCFWCTEAIFRRLKGVSKVESGYAGGKTANPSYWDVASGMTDHAEAIQITFDPKIITFTEILDVFWATHDPTSLNKQGADTGTEYRSVIFYHNDSQKNLAEKSKVDLEKSSKYDKPIVTEIVPFGNFFKAEDEHQNFYERNQDKLYCQLVIDPKIKKLMEEFSGKVKEGYK
jgi:peptide-methionine (S)-S-oxide reductase